MLSQVIAIFAVLGGCLALAAGLVFGGTDESRNITTAIAFFALAGALGIWRLVDNVDQIKQVQSRSGQSTRRADDDIPDPIIRPPQKR